MKAVRLLFTTFAQPLVVGVGIAVAVRILFCQFFSVPTSSMAPTLLPGDQIVVTPYRAPFDPEPARGDVIVFRRADRFFVKRVIGIGGDHVELRRTSLRVNGIAVTEPYVRLHSNVEAKPEIVPANSYYVLGDNRDDSIDSRSWGFVDRSQIVGRARGVLWSSTGNANDVAQAASHSAFGAGRSVPRRFFVPIR